MVVRDRLFVALLSLASMLASGCGPVGAAGGDGGAGPDGGTVHRDGGRPRDAGTPADGGSDGGGTDGGTVDGGGAPIPPGDPGAADLDLTVDATRDVHPISRYIYGTNANDPSTPAGVFTLARSGGNRWTAYDWENNASNGGSDYCFENDGYLGGGSTPGEAMRTRVAADEAAGCASLMTVPMAGYVSADENGGSGPPGCSGDVRSSGPSYLQTRFVQSVARKGSAFTYPPDTGDGVVYEDEMVHWLASTFPGAATDPTQALFFDLDNEPGLWSSTHAEIHPNPVTYDELLTKTVDYASAVKDADPDAVVFGPVSYGWQGYVNLQNAPDAGGRDFLDFYLSGIATAEVQAGKRLVDVLDLHWYPEATGGGIRITSDDASAPVADAREQAPRSLWDPTYTEQSWITQYSTNGPIALLPRMEQKIASDDPGVEISISEYYYGGGADISGGLAEADVLGILGREGVFAAAMWHLGSTDDRYILGAFEMYRDYDGSGGHLGDTSIHADTSDDAASSVYAAIDAGHPERMIVVALNKDRQDHTAAVRITTTVALHHAEIYRLDASSPSPVHAGSLDLSLVDAWKATLPAQSVTVYVLRP